MLCTTTTAPVIRNTFLPFICTLLGRYLQKCFRAVFMYPRGCGLELTVACMYSTTRLLFKPWHLLQTGSGVLPMHLMQYETECSAHLWVFMQLAAGRVGARAQAWQKSKKIQGRLYEWQYEGWMQCSALCVAHFAAFKKTFSSSLAIDVQACMSLGLAKTSFISYHISYHLLFTTSKITF